MEVAAARPINLQPLLVAPPSDGPMRGGQLPERLRARYGGELAIPLHAHRPTVVVNFVSTLDGVTSYNTTDAAGGGEISGFFEPDRLVMGLLRALADVVLIGAGTLRADTGGAWTAQAVHPDSDADFGTLRASLGLRANPLTAVLTASGSVDLAHPGLGDPSVEVLIITTEVGATALRRQPVPAHVQVRAVGEGAVAPAAVLAVLAERAARLVLCEGGGHLFGELVATHLVDELFLTVAPQLAGRSATTPRLSLIEDTAFTVTDAPWGRLIDLRRAGDHLFTRYQLPSAEGRTHVQA
jgi:riboflavin biosynthesis pyrimidine reductase